MTGYFRLPSVRHDLIVDTGSRAMIHHRRGEDETILTRILRDGTLDPEPPGIATAVLGLFA